MPTSGQPVRRASCSSSHHTMLPGSRPRITTAPSPASSSSAVAQRVLEGPRPRRARQRRREEPPRRDGERHERRRAHVVLEHAQLAARVAHDVGAGDRDARPALRQRRDLVLEPRAAIEQVGRHDARAKRLARAERIGDECLQRADALRQAGLQPRPLRGREHARDGVDGERMRAVVGAVDDAVALHARRDHLGGGRRRRRLERGEDAVVAGRAAPSAPNASSIAPPVGS